jgi:hypothetical protein
MKSKKELLRIVRTPEGEVVLDSTGKKSGRGAYVCNNDLCFRKAIKEKRFEKALQHSVAQEIYEQLRSGMDFHDK